MGKTKQLHREIQLRGVCKSFDGVPVLQDLDICLPAGTVCCLMAPSGAGKTTLMRLLLGLERLDAGSIDAPDHIRYGVVFQEDRLLDYLTPEGNIALVHPQLPRSEIREALEAVGLAGQIQQPCMALSGGQRRRVALLRALLSPCEVLLLDEPFKGLDIDTRALVIADMRWRIQGRTVLLITHDAAEGTLLGATQMLHL